MIVASDRNTNTLSDAAIWALERLAKPRYGSDSPALSWSVAQELIRAGFVSTSANGRGITSVTQAGRDFLLQRTRT